MLIVLLPAIGGGLALLALTWSTLGFGVFILAPALASGVALLTVLLLISFWGANFPAMCVTFGYRTPSSQIKPQAIHRCRNNALHKRPQQDCQKMSGWTRMMRVCGPPLKFGLSRPARAESRAPIA
jgi:hypothetical protein